jgi:6-phosphogluconolactonase
MIAPPLRLPVTLLMIAFSLALVGCGSGVHVCNVSGTGCCGGGLCPLVPGPEMLYATTSAANPNQILTMTIDSKTGALSSAVGIAGPANSLGLTGVNGQYLYASDTSGALVFGYAINQTNGALTTLTGSPFTTGVPSSPAGLGASPGGATGFLYAADGDTIDGFSVSPSTGLPSTVTGSPFSSGTNVWLVVDPFGKYLYSSDQDAPGGVLAFTIDATGALTMVAGSPFTIPGQTVSNSLPVGIVDTGTFVYVALSATNQIAAFAIVSGTGALTPVPGSPFSTGANPDLLVVGRGSFLYALNASDHTISGYSINQTSGVLTQITGSPFQIAGGTMTTDPYGQYLYVTSAAGIQAFNIDASTGMLTPVSGSPFPANGAFYLTAVQVPPPFVQ